MMDSVDIVEHLCVMFLYYENQIRYEVIFYGAKL